MVNWRKRDDDKKQRFFSISQKLGGFLLDKMVDIKVFNRWSVDGVTVADPGLIGYITLAPKILPKTGARYAGKRFHKSNVFIVERLATKLMNSGHKSKKHFMSSGHNTGKKNKVLKVVEYCMSKEIKLGKEQIKKDE